MNELEISLKSINDLIDEPTRMKFKQNVRNLESITGSLKRELDTGGSLKASLDNIRHLTDELKKSSEDITRMISNVSEISDSLNSTDIKNTLVRLDSTIMSTQSILAKIDKGEGSLGKLVNSDSLYLHLESASKNLEILLKDLQEHPERYVSISVFGKKNEE
jgi:phospholipid/cholesterol/gamma-HCH transport system substrate-binding protein